MTKKRGRPPFGEGEAKDCIFTLRMTKEVRAKLQEAAEQADMPITIWARTRLLEVAVRELVSSRRQTRDRTEGKRR